MYQSWQWMDPLPRGRIIGKIMPRVAPRQMHFNVIGTFYSAPGPYTHARRGAVKTREIGLSKHCTIRVYMRRVWRNCRLLSPFSRSLRCRGETARCGLICWRAAAFNMEIIGRALTFLLSATGRRTFARGYGSLAFAVWDAQVLVENVSGRVWKFSGERRTLLEFRVDKWNLCVWCCSGFHNNGAATSADILSGRKFVRAVWMQLLFSWNFWGMHWNYYVHSVFVHGQLLIKWL